MEQDRQALINQMLKNNPDDPFLIYAAALEYRKQNNQASTLSMFKKLIEEHPDYLATYYQIGKLYEEMGDVDAAIAHYKKGREVAKKENDLKTLSELSEALMILDEDDGEVW